MFKKISCIILLILSASSFGQSVDSFTPGKYRFYGKLIYKKSPARSRLILYPGTTRQYSIALSLKDMKRSILYNNKLIEVTGKITVKGQGIETLVHDAIIVKSSTQSNAISKGFTKY